MSFGDMFNKGRKRGDSEEEQIQAFLDHIQHQLLQAANHCSTTENKRCRDLSELLFALAGAIRTDSMELMLKTLEPMEEILFKYERIMQSEDADRHTFVPDGISTYTERLGLGLYQLRREMKEAADRGEYDKAHQLQKRIYGDDDDTGSSRLYENYVTDSDERYKGKQQDGEGSEGDKDAI